MRALTLLLPRDRNQKLFPKITIGGSKGFSPMNEDTLNTSVRKYLKKVGVTSQREIEKAVRAAIADGRLKGSEKLPAKMVLTVTGVDLSLAIDGDVELE
jgi:hypothetical protein